MKFVSTFMETYFKQLSPSKKRFLKVISPYNPYIKRMKVPMSQESLAEMGYNLVSLYGLSTCSLMVQTGYLGDFDIKTRKLEIVQVQSVRGYNDPIYFIIEPCHLPPKGTFYFLFIKFFVKLLGMKIK